MTNIDIRNTAKNAAIGARILSLVSTGISLPAAYDAVMGAGSYAMLADTLYEKLKVGK